MKKFLFNNINGLSLSLISLSEFISTLLEVNIDWISLAETHIDLAKHQVEGQVKSTINSLQEFSHSNCCFSARNLDYGTEYKQEGTLQIAVNNLATRTIKVHSDSMGRFNSQTFVGTNSKRLTILTHYWVVNGRSGPSSA